MLKKLFGVLALVLLLMLVAGVVHARDGCIGWGGYPTDRQMASHIAVIDGEVGQPEVMALSFSPSGALVSMEKGSSLGPATMESPPRVQADLGFGVSWPPGGAALAFT